MLSDNKINNCSPRQPRYQEQNTNNNIVVEGSLFGEWRAVHVCIRRMFLLLKNKRNSQDK